MNTVNNKRRSRLGLGVLALSLAAPAFAPLSESPQKAEFKIQGAFC